MTFCEGKELQGGHLNSYNEFMERGLQSIIDEVGEIEIETAEYPYKIKLGKIKLQQT